MPNRLEEAQSSKVTSVGSTQDQVFRFWVFGFSSLDDFRSKSSEDGMLSNDKCQFLSEQPTS